MFSSLPLFSLTHPPKQAISVSAFIQPTSLIDFLSRQDGEYCFAFWMLFLFEDDGSSAMVVGWTYFLCPPVLGVCERRRRRFRTGEGNSSRNTEFRGQKIRMLTISLSIRFSRSTSSTLRLRLRPVSTSSRYGDICHRPFPLAHHNHQGPSADSNFSFFFLDSCAYAPLLLHGR